MGAQPDARIIDRLSIGGKDDDRALGADNWMKKTLSGTLAYEPRKTFEEIIDNFCCRYDVTEKQLASPSRHRLLSRIRAESALAASKTGAASISEVARRFGRSQPTLSRAVGQLRKHHKL